MTKLTNLLIISLAMVISLSVYAQAPAVVNIDMHDVPLKRVLDEIQEQTS